MPAVWNTGEHTSTVDPGRMRHGTGRARLAAMLATGNSAPFGTPVVPEV